MKCSNWILCTILFITCIDLFSQSLPLSFIHYKKYGPKEGIVDKQISTIYQSKDGLMWFGGKFLQSFDGHRFIQHKLPVKTGIISSIFEHNSGLIFIIIDYKLVYTFNKSNTKFTDVTKKYNDGHHTITQAIIDEQDNVWLNLSQGLGYINKEGKFNFVESPLGKKYTIIGDFFMENKAILWFLVKDVGIVRYKTKENEWTTPSQNKNNENIFNYPIQYLNSIKRDFHGNFWFIEKQAQLVKFDANKQLKKSYVIPYPSLINNKENITFLAKILIDQKGFVWVLPGQNLGLARYDDKNDKLEILYSDKGKSYGISDDAVMGSYADLFEDRQGNFWYLGLNIYSFNPYLQKTITIETKHLMYEQTPINGIVQGTTPCGFTEMNDGRIYIGYYGSGILSLDKNFLNPRKVVLPEYISKLIWSIYSNDGENLYFSDQNKLFYKYNIRSKEVCKAVKGNQFLRYTGAYYIESDSIIWLGHHRDGISKFNTKKSEVSSFKAVSYPNKQSDENIFAIYPEGKNHLWLASSKSGLILFDKVAGKSISAFHHSSSDAIKSYFDLTPLSMDTLLLASTQGIVLFNKKNRSFENIPQSEELASSSCSSIAVQDKKIQINTFYNGLFTHFLRAGKSYAQSIDEDNNFPRGDMPKYQFKNKDVAFSHNNGFTIVKSENKAMTASDSIYITQLMVNDNPYKTDETLNLAHDQNHIYIGVSTLNFAELSNTKYYVKADMFFGQWKLLEKRPELVLNKLASGKYKFQFKAVNIYSNKETPITTFIVNIDTPWHKKWWFLLGLLFVAISLVIAIERNKRVKAITIERLSADALQKKLELEKKQRQLEEINTSLTELKLSNLRSKMNPHFIFNTLNSINSYVIKNDIHSASDYITKFSKLIRHILDQSKEEVIPLKQELETLQLYLHIESLRFNQNLNFTIDLKEGIDAEEIKIPPMLIQPFVENAIWHGLMPSKKNKSLSLKIFKSDTKLICIEIEDNGIGREKAKENKLSEDIHKSQGIEITEQRLKYINQKNSIDIFDKKDEIGHAAGTLVSIYLYQ